MDKTHRNKTVINITHRIQNSHQAVVNNYLLLLKYEMLHSGRDPDAGTQFPDASQTDIGLPDMT